MEKIRELVRLRHRANLDGAITLVELAAGEEVSILKEWRDHYLIKNAAGQLFNISKDLVSAG